MIYGVSVSQVLFISGNLKRCFLYRGPFLLKYYKNGYIILLKCMVCHTQYFLVEVEYAGR